MVEPQNTFISRDFGGEVFVGPAQCGKTQSLLLNSVAYTVLCDPMDMIIYNPTQPAARDFSMRRIDRMHRNSEHAGVPSEIGKQLLSAREADNKFDKHYKSGMILSISWPSSAELAGRPIGRVMITDRDRMDDDIEGEGEIFDLARKRTTTFQSFAMCCAESSPSRPITDPKWVRRTPHEAPPCKGILGLYNRGDRRRWYWPCPNCGSYFEGNFRMLRFDRTSDAKAAADSVYMECPSCVEPIFPSQRYDMNLRGVWLKDGQTIDRDGVITGAGPRTDIASFWVNGVAAAFTSWGQLVQTYIAAEDAFERSGDEEPLMKFYNTDLGEPYVPKAMERQRFPETLQGRAEDWGGSAEEPVVPDGVRFLIATVDVQQNMFIVQVHGIKPGVPEDIALVDRFRIRLSKDRMDDDGQLAWVKPGSYLEDWDLITEQVLDKTYPLGDGSGRRMAIKMTGCDSGGKAGVTSNAYQYFRKLRGSGYGGRFQLVKGNSTPGAPRVYVAYPDSKNPKMQAAAQGDIPVLMLHSNQLKDMLDNRLDCIVPGAGMVSYPSWFPDWFYVELCIEIRGEKGWEKPYHARNEAWDLMYYCLGILLSPAINISGISWEKPPRWADTWDKNNMISESGDKSRFAIARGSDYDFGSFGKALG